MGLEYIMSILLEKHLEEFFQMVELELLKCFIGQITSTSHKFKDFIFFFLDAIYLLWLVEEEIQDILRQR